MSEGYKITSVGWPVPKSEIPIKEEDPKKDEPPTPTRKEMKFSVKLIIAGVLVGIFSLFIRACGSPYYQSTLDEMSGRYSRSPIWVLAPFVSVVLIILGVVFYFLQSKSRRLQ